MMALSERFSIRPASGRSIRRLQRWERATLHCRGLPPQKLRTPTVCCTRSTDDIASSNMLLGEDVKSVRDHHMELRRNIVSKMPEGSVIYLEGGTAVPRNGSDVYYTFRPDSDFFYLTGCAEPGFGALIDKTTGRYTLFSANIPADMQHWVGRLPSLEDLADEYGADACAYIDDAPRMLKALDVPVLHSLPGKIGEAAKKSLVTSRTNVNDKILQRILRECREFKSDSEIACLRVASKVTSAAHMAVIRASRSSNFEFELQAVFLHATVGAGLKHMGYPAIIGAGKNSAILHYERNDGPIMPHDAVLMDAGSEYRCYTADVTRTFPARGRFSPQMADVYDAVLAVQDVALQCIQPGASWEHVSIRSRSLLAQMLIDLNLARGSIDAILDMELDKLFMPHGEYPADIALDVGYHAATRVKVPGWPVGSQH